MDNLTKEQKVAIETILEAIKPIQCLKVVVGNPNHITYKENRRKCLHCN